MGVLVEDRLDTTIPLFAVLRVLGIVLALFSITMLLPLGFAFFGEDPALIAYQEAIRITAVAGLLLAGLT